MNLQGQCSVPLCMYVFTPSVLCVEVGGTKGRMV